MEREGREKDELRKTVIQPYFLENPLGSVLIESGKTKVICTVMLEDSVPSWIEENEDLQHGWLTARYGMLPGSGDTRIRRERYGARGRTKEIQRLIGRCLRASIDLDKISGMTLWVDCDVIQADGGTRTASITGAWAAMKLAVEDLIDSEQLDEDPVEKQIAATSVGLMDGEAYLDLSFQEDTGADVDMNLVMDSEGNFIEIQATAEESVFSREEQEHMLELGEKGIKELFQVQDDALSD